MNLRKHSFLAAIAILPFGNIFGQGTPTPQTNYTIQDVNSTQTTNVSSKTINVNVDQPTEFFDLSSHNPVITTRLTDKYPLEMPSLMAYPIYMNSSIERPDSLSIDSMTISIAGQQYSAQENANGYYYYLWTPASYGTHTIEMKSYASNGNETSISKDIVVSNSSMNQNVATLDEINITWLGVNDRQYSGTYFMPQHVGAYDNLTANLDFACPATADGCDAWDRRAYIDIKAPDGNWIQIIRYITPYGIGCSHTVDLTDYADILQGELEFRVFIDTWGTGGWLVSLDFDFNAGTPTYNYSSVGEVWDGKYDLGNPTNLQPLDTVNYNFPANTEDAKLRVSTTGHGWGPSNTKNAAEFYPASNNIFIDGVKTFNQNLWNLCNPNPDGCKRQLGKMYFSRAGWCPGAIAHPNEYSLKPYINSGIELIYQFDPFYEDLCNPNNPDCISNTATCQDCNKGGNPSFDVDVQIVSYSNSPLLYTPKATGFKDNILNYNVDVYPNPTKNTFKINTADIKGETKVFIHGVNGRTVRTYYFNSNTEINNYLFDLASLPKGTYFINIENQYGKGVKPLILQ